MGNKNRKVTLERQSIMRNCTSKQIDLRLALRRLFMIRLEAILVGPLTLAVIHFVE